MQLIKGCLQKVVGVLQEVSGAKPLGLDRRPALAFKNSLVVFLNQKTPQLRGL